MSNAATVGQIVSFQRRFQPSATDSAAYALNSRVLALAQRSLLEDDEYPVTKSALDLTHLFISHLPSAIMTPRVTTSGEGGFSFEWRDARIYFVVELHLDGVAAAYQNSITGVRKTFSAPYYDAKTADFLKWIEDDCVEPA